MSEAKGCNVIAPRHQVIHTSLSCDVVPRQSTHARDKTATLQSSRRGSVIEGHLMEKNLRVTPVYTASALFKNR